MSALKMFSKSIKSTHRVSRLFSALPNVEVSTSHFRTDESNPLCHTPSHQSKFYTMNSEIRKQVFAHGGLPKDFRTQIKTFTETSIMIREPALEVFNIMQLSDYSKPVNRVVLYGEIGVGKSLTLAHIIHYGYLNDYLLMHVPWVPMWLRLVLPSKEIAHSKTIEGNIDLPLDAAEWLIQFKKQNSKFLKDPNLVVSKDYSWSKRENTPNGAPLSELIELGINRVKYASDIILALTREIKILSNKKVCKTLVAIDGFNSFFYPRTTLKTDSKKVIAPNEVTMTQAFLELTKNDWCNGFIVTVVDKVATNIDQRESYYPKYLLNKEGFEHMDPYIPIEVKNYSENEFLNCMSYYRDRLWIRGYPDAETELAFTSGRNPGHLMKLCAPL